MLVRGLGFLFPPISLFAANRHIRTEMEKVTVEDMFTETTQTWMKKVASTKLKAALMEEKNRIEASETHRKDVVESKASALLTALGVSVTLLAIIIAIVVNGEVLPSRFVVPLVIFFGIASLHLIFSAYYAVAVTLVTSMYVDTPDSVAARLGSNQDFESLVIAEGFSNLEMNFRPMRLRTNYLATAQSLFMRGIILIGIGPVVLLGGDWLIQSIQDLVAALRGC